MRLLSLLSTKILITSSQHRVGRQRKHSSPGVQKKSKCLILSFWLMQRDKKNKLTLKLTPQYKITDSFQIRRHAVRFSLPPKQTKFQNRFDLLFLYLLIPTHIFSSNNIQYANFVSDMNMPWSYLGWSYVSNYCILCFTEPSYKYRKKNLRFCTDPKKLICHDSGNNCLNRYLIGTLSET